MERMKARRSAAKNARAHARHVMRVSHNVAEEAVRVRKRAAVRPLSDEDQAFCRKYSVAV